jgi:hypothetical protein
MMPAMTTLECGMLVASIYLEMEMEHFPQCVNLTLIWFVVLIDFGFMVLVSVSYLHLQLQYAICNMQYAICNMQYAIFNMQYAI